MDDRQAINWEEVLVQVHAFTRALLKKVKWFSGNKTDSFLKGKQVDDYVYDAIKKYLSEPEKYEPEKGTLVNYLNYSLVRSMVSNDIKVSKNQNTVNETTLSFQLEENGNDNADYMDKIMPYVEVLCDDNLDYKDVVSKVESQIQGDLHAENIFLGLYTFGLKRRQIIQEFEMTEADYDNGVRRLRTVLNHTSKFYNYKN